MLDTLLSALHTGLLETKYAAVRVASMEVLVELISREDGIPCYFVFISFYFSLSLAFLSCVIPCCLAMPLLRPFAQRISQSLECVKNDSDGQVLQLHSRALSALSRLM